MAASNPALDRRAGEPAADAADAQADRPLPDTLPAHLVALPDRRWALWRTAVLRGAGFPARDVLRLAAPAGAAAADRVLELEARLEECRAGALRAVHDALDALRSDGRWSDRSLRRPLMKAMQALTGGKLPQGCPAPACAPALASLAAAAAALAVARQELARTWESEGARVSAEIRAVARGDLFREAALWQNRHAVETAFDELGGQPIASAARSSRRRQHEELVASYLQRYCTKNDTIGFFGPVAFADLAGDGEAISLRCGAGLLQQRTVYFETWCIDRLAESLGRNAALRPWLAPRLKSSFYLDGRSLHRPFGKPLALAPAEARLLAWCDGYRIARDVARALIAEATTPFTLEEEVYRLIEELCKRRVLTWALQVPPDLHPDRALAALLARIESEPLRAAAMTALEELQRARDRVALAAASPAALDAALRGAESTFSRLTGVAPRQRPGQTYAARGLLYEDCRRDIDVVFGPELTRRLGRPLALVLQGARWLAGELARGLDEPLRLLHSRLCSQLGSPSVDGHAFFTSALSAIFYHPERQAALAVAERRLQDRWSRVLGPLPAAARQARFTASALADRCAAAFADAGPAWTLCHYFSPDVMIAAAGEAALRNGDFELVLGEIHAGNTLLWSCFISQHPAPQEISGFLELDTGSSIVVVPQTLQPGWPRRVSPGLTLPSWYHFHFADDCPSDTAGRPLPAGALVVEDTPDGLRARTRDGRLAFGAIDLFGAYLTAECSGLIGAILEAAPHVPRLSFDDVIVSRERWHLTAGEMDLAAIREPAERFLALRQWARGLGLPRFCFYKVATERKPCFLDLDSPISGDIFCHLVRAARAAGAEVKVTVSEMTPGLDQLWLRDEAANLYTCELRLAALERRS